MKQTTVSLGRQFSRVAFALSKSSKQAFLLPYLTSFQSADNWGWAGWAARRGHDETRVLGSLRGILVLQGKNIFLAVDTTDCPLPHLTVRREIPGSPLRTEESES